MAGQQKRYVFRELVKDTKDPIQLIAYAFYKKHKDDIAQIFETQHGADAVPAHLQNWHDVTANDPTQIENYITTAKIFMSVITDELNEAAKNELAVEHAAAIGALNALHQQAISDLSGKVTNAENKARTEWAEKMSTWAAETTKPNKFLRCVFWLIKWIGATVAATFGGAVVTGFFVALLAMINPSLSASANSIAKGIIDKVLPADDPSGMAIDNYMKKPVSKSEGNQTSADDKTP